MSTGVKGYGDSGFGDTASYDIITTGAEWG